MANEQGRFTGTTVIATIGEDVNLGQVVYCRELPADGNLPPDLIGRGVWFKAAADHSYTQSEGYIYDSMNQLGVVVEAASYSTISLTQSGTTTTILLDGYYSPGLLGFGGYATGEGFVGSPLYLMPNSGPDALRIQDGVNADGILGCVSWKEPDYYGATEGAVRVIGYYWDIVYPYVIRFSPDMSWTLIPNIDRFFS